MKFDAINCHHLESILNLNGIAQYLETIGQVKIHEYELAQFYANLHRDTNETRLFSLVNQVIVITDPELFKTIIKP